MIGLTNMKVMRNFQYRALNSDGAAVEAICEAESRADVLQQLKSLGLCTLELREVLTSSPGSLAVGRSAISRFYMMLGDQLQVGVPLLSALELIGRQERAPDAKRLVESIARRVESGASLGDAVSQYEEVFSEVDLNLIRAGEEGGFLPDALERIAQMREWQQKLTANVWGAAAYPLLLVAVAMVLVPCVLVYLVPKLEPIFESLRRDAQLPWATSTLLTISNVCRNYGGICLTAMICLGMLGYFLIPRGRLIAFRDRTILLLPFLGELVRDFVLARFCRILGTLLQNRIQVLTALEIATKVLGNRFMEKSLVDAQEAVASGKLLADALGSSQQIPADALAMIGVAEQSNTLAPVLIKVAQQMETRTNRRLETAVKMIEPLLLLVMAVLVGFVVLALLLPIFEGQTLG